MKTQKRTSKAITTKQINNATKGMANSQRLWKEAISPVLGNKKQTILQEAQSVVYGDRQSDYGDVTTNFDNIARLWSVILGVEVTKEQVGLCMIQTKITRQIYKPKRELLIDICGYAACIEKLENGK